MFNDEMMQKLCYLAKLENSEAETEEFKAFLEEFAQKAETVNINYGTLEPLVHFYESDKRRKDEVKQEISRDEMLSNAPNHEYGFITAPLTLELEA